MEICVIARSFEPIEKMADGYSLRCMNIVRHLQALNHNVTILEFSRENKVIKIMNMTFMHMKCMAKNPLHDLFAKLLTFDPIKEILFITNSFLVLLKYKKVIEKCDTVLIEGALIPSAFIISKVARKNIIFDTHCINRLLAKNYKKRNLLVYFLRTIFWDFLERFAIKMSDVIITVSESEKEFVIKEYKAPETKVFVVPNIVEPPRKVPKEVAEGLRGKLGLKNKIVVTFVGNLESVQNADAVEYIINELAPWFWKKRRDVVFLIIGRGKDRFKCDLPNVVFTGFVKELGPYLVMSDICIAPLRVGAGIKTKIIEYLAYGKTVITTPIGIEGLENFINPNIVHICSIEAFKDVLYEVISKGMLMEERTRESNLSPMYREFEDKIKAILKVIK